MLQNTETFWYYYKLLFGLRPIAGKKIKSCDSEANNLSAGFHESLCRGDLVDVTLAAEGQFVKAHRLVLSVCSPYFRKMFTQMPANQHAFVFLKDVSHTALKDLIQFMYCGEVNVKQEALPAFISTAEALQIKGLTDSDPPPSQTPPEPSTPTPQLPQQIQTSPRVRQRPSAATRPYKIETVDDGGDESGKQTTQIVIQTTATAAPQATMTAQAQTAQPTHLQTQQQQQHIQSQLTSVSMPTATTATVVTHKRPAQRTSLSSVPHVKRTKSTIDPLEGADATTATQQISVQTAVVTESKAQVQQQQQQQQQSEPEYIDLPIELPTKSEPDYADETGEVDQAEGDAAYVEDESYGDMRYDESYFTENEDAAPTAPTNVSVSNTPTGTTSSGNNAVGATTSKAIVKQQTTSFSDTSYVDTGDQTNNDAQGVVKFIRSQKKNAQLVYNGYIYNKKLTQANNNTTWRCIDVLKMRCKAVVITKKNKLVAARREHNHDDHLSRIGERPLYNEEEDLGEYIELKTDSANLIEDLQFIESPWATPCLVLYGFMFNCHSRKNNKEYWRCHNYSKKIHSERCRIRCVIENGKLKSISGGGIYQSLTILYVYIADYDSLEDYESLVTDDDRVNRVKYRSSLKGSYQLVLDGFPYTRHRCRGTTIYWRCVQFRPLNCKARVRTNPTGDRVSIVDERHNHSILKERLHKQNPAGKECSKTERSSTGKKVYTNKHIENDDLHYSASNSIVEIHSPQYTSSSKVTLHKELNHADEVIKTSKNQHSFSVINRPRWFGRCVYCLKKPNVDRKKLVKITTYCPQCPGGCWTCEQCFDERH
uniref:BTB domain-containing protein n=1 Tax=Glossina morsitans morsitans TaxID=37546 RepID=A0ABK9MFA2_GLOMM